MSHLILNSKIMIPQIYVGHMLIYISHYYERLTFIWRNAHLINLTSLFPHEYGWSEQENKYEFVWFEGDRLPP